MTATRSAKEMLLGPNRSADYREVAAIAQHAQPDLFRLADMVTTDAEQRAWDGIVVDEVGGHYPGMFIRTILAEQAARRGQPPPASLSVASSSRHLMHPEHRNVLTKHLAQAAKGWNRALFVTEVAETGYAGSCVASDLRTATGAETDFAVMAGYAPDKYKRRLGPIFFPDSRLYIARDNVDVMSQESMNSNLIREASGIKTEYRLAEPLPLPRIDTRLVHVAQLAFGTLAQQYIDTRL